MKKPISKRKDGERLNQEGRISPLELFQERMEHHRDLALAELAKGDAADMEMVQTEFKLAQDAGAELAVYRHPRLAATAVVNGGEDELAELLKFIDGKTRGTNYGKKPVLN